MNDERPNPIPDDADEPTDLAEVHVVEQCLSAISNETLASGDLASIRRAIAEAVRQAHGDHRWREILQGAGLDSPAGRRVLSAVRRAIARLDLHRIAINVHKAETVEEIEAIFTAALSGLDSQAAAEVDGAPFAGFDVYRSKRLGLLAVPRDTGGRPLRWDREAGRLRFDPRHDRDTAHAALGAEHGPDLRAARIDTADTLQQAENLCRQQRDGGDIFARALQEEETGDPW